MSDKTQTLQAESPSGEKRLSRSAIIIGVCSFLSDSSSEMIYPVLPIFLQDTLKAPASVIGIIEGITNGAANLIQIVSGRLSDRWGRRKPVAFTGYLLSAISRPLMGLAGVWQVVFVARFSDRMGKGIRSAPKQALLAEAALESARGRVFGYDRAMDYFGSVVGPLLCLIFLSLFALNARSIFFIASIPALLSGLMLLAVRETSAAVRSPLPASSFRGFTPEYKRFLLISAVFGLANSANSFLILRAKQLGLTNTQAILAYALFNGVSAIGSMPAGSASDRFGRRNLLIIGYGIYALVYAGFGLARQTWLIWFLFAAYGMFPALTDGVAKALAVDTAGKQGRATAIGVFSAVNGLTQIAASYLGGRLYDMDARMMFYFDGALAAISVVLLCLLLPVHIRRQQTEIATT